MKIINFRVCELYCGHCHWRFIANSADDLKGFHEIKTASIQTNIPSKDPATKKVADSKFSPQKKKFRCPKCGFSVVPKIIKDAQKELDFKIEQSIKEKEIKDLEEFISDHKGRKKSEDESSGFDGSETSDEGSQV